MPVRWIIPVDLASVHDFTAVGAVEVSDTYPRRYTLPALHRWRGPYPETVDRVVKIANRPQFLDAILVVDATGVGRPVVDLLRVALPGRVVYGVTITGGTSFSRGQTVFDLRVPKRDLVGATQVMFQAGRIDIAREHELSELLVKELMNFEIKVSDTGHETFEAGREGKNDDLVLALSMACWLGDRLPGPLPDPEDLVLSAPHPDDVTLVPTALLHELEGDLLGARNFVNDAIINTERSGRELRRLLGHE